MNNFEVILLLLQILVDKSALLISQALLDINLEKLMKIEGLKLSSSQVEGINDNHYSQVLV